MGLRLLLLLVMTVLLLIPQVLISLLVDDRSTTAARAAREIAEPWGEEQTLCGPLISVPYYVKDKESCGFEEYMAFFQPDSVTIAVRAIPEERTRGIFSVLLYRTKIEVRGVFTGIDKTLFPANEWIEWDEMKLVQPVKDVVGLKAIPKVQLRDTTLLLESSNRVDGMAPDWSTLSSPLRVRKDGRYEFSYEYAVNGSQELNFHPSAAITNVDLSLLWDKPSFVGKFLPDERTLTDSLTTAHWTVLSANTSQSLSWAVKSDRSYYSEYGSNDRFSSSEEFGVKLLMGIDHYDKVERAVKFAVLMIVFTFLTFFFTDSLLKKPIPMIGYVLTGLAILLFYTLLLSISEYINFGLSYLIAAGAITVMISLYMHGFIKRLKPVLICAGILVILYTFLYIILQMANFPLLVGSLFLFLVLSVVMYLSQRLEW